MKGDGGGIIGAMCSPTSAARAAAGTADTTAAG